MGITTGTLATMMEAYKQSGESMSTDAEAVVSAEDLKATNTVESNDKKIKPFVWWIAGGVLLLGVGILVFKSKKGK